MNTKKTLALLLSMLMLASCTVSCSESDVQETSADTNAPVSAETAADTAESTPEETETPKLMPELPEITFDGFTFRMIGKGTSLVHWQSKDLTAEEITGEPINDAVYNRNALISERYDVNFKEFTVANLSAQQTEVALSCQAGTDEYDMAAFQPEGAVTSLISNGYIMNLHDIPHMDLTRPWYDQSSIAQMSVGGKLFCTMGSMLTMDDDATGAIFFNKQLADMNALPDLYEMVENGTWTIDRLTEYADLAKRDANGDGKMTAMEDVWGTISEYVTTFALISGSGKTMITKDEADLPVNTSSDEAFISMYEKVLKIQNNYDMTMYAENQSGFADVWADCIDATFQSDRALFNICWLNRASLFREMETDFGIVPMPKYNEAQSGYYSFVQLACANSIAVPTTGQNFERTGVILEALSAESMYGLTEAYYEKTLKSKASRDEESAAMLDLIFDTRVYDLGFMYNWGTISSSVGSLVGTEGQDISGYASAMKKATKAIDKAIKNAVKDLGITE
ncbi:MAG: hypothetical protein IJF78_16965 [Clostridia bacterium]|nr:hypothetical protein [Clostridia bacterium]